MRRSNFTFAHRNPFVRLALAWRAVRAVHYLDSTEVEPMEVCS